MFTIFNSLQRGGAIASTRLATKNVLLAGKVTRPLLALPMRAQPFSTVSQVTKDYRKTMAKQLEEDKVYKLSDKSRYGQKFSVPDYEVGPESLLINVVHKQPERSFTKDQHPIESMAKAQRVQTD